MPSRVPEVAGLGEVSTGETDDDIGDGFTVAPVGGGGGGAFLIEIMTMQPCKTNALSKRPLGLMVRTHKILKTSPLHSDGFDLLCD